MLLMLGTFVYSKVKSGLVQKLALAVVLNWAALATMPSNRPIIKTCALRSSNKSLVLGAFAQEERSRTYCSCSTTTPKPADAQGRVTAANPAGAVGMAATATK
jgi:hypothetical protein